MRSKDEEEVLEIDALELFFVLLKHWKSIALSTVLAAAIALLASLLIIVPTYESTSELYVLSKSTSITSLTDIQMGTSLTNDYIVVVTGRPVLEQVIANLNLDTDYEELLEHVSTNNPSNSRILEITVQDADANMAKLITDEIATVSAAFISEKMDQDPPSIIQYGYADEKPVSPKTAKNTVIGALLGAILAMGIIVLLHLFNDTIMNTEDIEKKLGLNVLGMLPLENESEYDGETEPRRRKRVK